MIVAYLLQCTVANYWIDRIPTENAAALVFHFARETDVSDKIVVEKVEHSEYTGNYGQYCQVYGFSIQILDKVDTSNY